LQRSDWIKPGATVIDVGTTRVIRDGKKKLLGDVDFHEFKNCPADIRSHDWMRGCLASKRPSPRGRSIATRALGRVRLQRMIKP